MTTMANVIAPPQGVEKKETGKKLAMVIEFCFSILPPGKFLLNLIRLGGSEDNLYGAQQPFVLSSMHCGTCFIVAHDSV